MKTIYIFAVTNTPGVSPEAVFRVSDKLFFQLLSEERSTNGLRYVITIREHSSVPFTANAVVMDWIKTNCKD